MSAPHWMPLYVADYMADTGHLSTIEHGAYMLLIMHYWQHGGLPQDGRKLARICRMGVDEWDDVAETMAGLFGPGWTHKRIDAELATAEQTINKRSAAGKAGAYARYGKRNAIASANAHQTDAQPPIQSPSDATHHSRAADLDNLESELREAAGQLNNPSPSLLDLSPIATLIAKGYSLHNDILPKLRAAAGQGKRPSTWAYYVPMITEGKARAESIPPKAQSPPPQTWVSVDHDHWLLIAERWQHANGRPLKPITSKHQTGFGAYIPTDWLTDTAKAA